MKIFSKYYSPQIVYVNNYLHITYLIRHKFSKEARKHKQ